MIEQIYDIDKLNDLVNNKEQPLVRFKLSKEEIEKWKENGNFKHIRNQIIDLNLKFSCVQLDNGSCHYYIITPTSKLNERITHMLSMLYEDIKLPLVKCYDVDAGSKNLVNVTGNVKMCNLF